MFHLFHFILFAFYFGAFIFLISGWRSFEIEGLSRNKLIAFFAFKVWAGLVITLVYTYYYTDTSKADIYRYFNDSKIISSVLFTNPRAWLKIIAGLGPLDKETFGYIANTLHYSHPQTDLVTSNSFIIRVISILNYFSLYNIYTNALLLDCMGFIGLTALFKSLQSFFKQGVLALCIPVYLLPSVVFWSSGLLKESILLPAIGAFIYAAFKLMDQPKVKVAVVLVIMLLIIAATKIYVAVFLLFCTPLLFAAKTKFMQARIPSGLVALFYIISLTAGLYFSGYKICSETINKRNEFIHLAIAENAGSTVDTSFSTADCHSVARLLPSAIKSSLFRPFLWDRGSTFQLLFAVENMFLLMSIIVLMLFFFNRPSGNQLRLAGFFMLFAVLNYLSIGLTVPVMGAIVHYRVIATPFLLIGVFLLTDFDKLRQTFAKS